MIPQVNVRLSTSILSKVASATTTDWTDRTNASTIGPYEAPEKVPLPTPTDYFEELENLPLFSDDEEDTSNGEPANIYVRTRRDSTSSVSTIRGREHSRSVKRRVQRLSRQPAPYTRRNRPLIRAEKFVPEDKAIPEFDWSAVTGEWKPNPSVTTEGFFQLNPGSPASTRTHASTLELAELINLIANEAKAAEALDRSSAAVVAGMPTKKLFEVSLKFEKHHITVSKVDFKYAFSCRLDVSARILTVPTSLQGYIRG